MINRAMSFSYGIPGKRPYSLGFCILANRPNPSPRPHRELEVGRCIIHLLRVDGVVVWAFHRKGLPIRRCR